MIRSLSQTVFGVLLWSAGVMCGAATWYVDQSLGQSGDGTSWESAFVTMGEGIGAAAEGDAVIVAPGTYQEIRIEGKGLTIQSSDPVDPDVIATTRVGFVSIRGGDGSVINGFTISEKSDGGVNCWGSSASIINNVIIESGGPSHGVIFCKDCSPLIGCNVIARNSGPFEATVFCWNSSPLIVNNTLVGNSPLSGVGGIYADSESSPTIVNCILWDNGEDLFNCTATYSCIKEARGGEGNIATDPYFVDPQNGDYRLLPWSPCIDAGDPSSEFALEPEPNGGRINMGAYGNTLLAASKSADMDGDALPDDWELNRFGNLDEVGEGDADGDGIWNAHEYLYGWDPKSADVVNAENVTTGRVYGTIQAAICESENGDEIVVPPGAHYENISFFGRAIALRSFDPFDPEVVAATILDGGGVGSTVKFCSGEGPESLLTGLTITGGSALKGGGVRCYKSSPTITGNVIEGNATSGVGGGVCSVGGSPRIEENIVAENFAQQCGGGLYLEGGSPSVLSNAIHDNLAVNWAGGGIGCRLTQAGVITGNTISGNCGANGGCGLDFRSCQGILVSNNLIVGNGDAGYSGLAGVYVIQTAGTFINCTIAMNMRHGVARGHGQGSVEAVNCILWGNQYGPMSFDSCTLSYCCLDEWEEGEGNIVSDPLFVDAENGDFRLRPASPCIDAGNNDVLNLPETDIVGAPRIVFGGRSRTVDMGAYEYMPLTITKDASGVTLTWGSVPGKTYEIYHAADLLTYGLAHTVLASGPITSWSDNTLKTALAPLRFYRVLENP